MNKILVTGNCGMIGSVLSSYFLDNGFEVIGIDDFSGGYLRNLDNRIGNKFKCASILNYKTLDEIFNKERPNFVIHCACFAAECLSPFIRNFIAQNIVVGTTNIINCCIKYEIEKIIHFSSAARYGNIPAPYKESDIPKPNDLYGIYKFTNELDLEEASKHFGLRYSVVAPHNVISYKQVFCDPYRNVAAIFIRRVLENKNLQIFGNGEQLRAMSDCSYLCEPIKKLLYDFDGHLFNLGADKTISIKELAQLIIEIGRCYGYNKSSIEYLQPRNEVKYCYSDHTKAKELLNFQDKTDLDDLIDCMFLYAIERKVWEEPMRRMNYEITKNLPPSWI